MAARLFLLVEERGSPAPPTGGRPAKGSGPEVKLSQAQSLTLQQELRLAYEAPAFQRNLVSQKLQEGDLPHPRAALKKLVRKAQAQVLPRYNFEATDEGVAALAAILERYPNSPEAPGLVALLGEALKVVGISQAQDLERLQRAEAEALAQPRYSQANKALSLTRAGAEDLLSRLQAVQGSRRFQRLGLILSNTTCFPVHTAPSLPRKFSELELVVYAEILPRFGFDDGMLGMTDMWRALQPFLGEPSMLEKAQVILQKPSLPGGSGDVSSLTRRRAVSMQQQLLERCSAPPFQAELNKLHREHHPCSDGFCERLASLLAPVYSQVLPKYGFTCDEEGLEVWTLAMGKVLPDLGVQAFAAAIDGLLYGPVLPPAQAETATEDAEASSEDDDDDWQPTIGDCAGFVEAPAPLLWNRPNRRLSRQQALQLLRQHMAAFSAPAFQHKVSVLRAAAAHEACPAGRARLALAVQQEILPTFGLEASPAGAHSMLQLCAEHILDPEVARLTASIHYLLGMEEPACKDIVARLSHIQEEVPLPLWW